MERYSNSIREVGQDGRRGALMLTLSVHHPDIETFINIKNDATKVTGANISVRLTDEFLKAVDNDEEYELRFPVDSKKPTYTRKIKAKDIWNKIVNSAWNRAEPGLLFWDNIIRESPTDCYELFVTISTNPCSEIPLSAYDSCRLISINLMSFIVNAFTKNAYFDYNMFYQTVMIAQRLMDDLVDLELECIDKILAKIEADPESKTVKSVERELWQKVRQSCIGGRRTGLGTTALGDCLAAINVKYGSNESISVVDRIYKTLKFGSYRSSVDMAKELGPFPEWNWESEEDNPFINRIKDETVFFDIPWEDHGCQIDNFIVSGAELYADIKKYGRRNVANLTNAPTGTISTQAGYQINNKWYHNTTSGIEPLFKTHYTRRKKGNPGDDNFRVDFKDQNGDCWMEFPVYHKGVEAWMNVTGNTEITDDCPYKGATAEEIDWIQRVKLQAAAQKHIDHAISSTINLPENVSKEEVAKIYKEAWKSGLKGITVYRDNCRTGVLITKQPEKVQNVDRPKELPCDVYHLTSKGTQYFVLIGLLDSKPYEIFAGKNGFLDKSVKSGKIIRKAKRMYKAVFDDADSTELCPITQSCSDHEETITRLTSALLRSGADIHLIVEQLEKVHGDMTSFAKIVARALKKYIKDGTKVDGEECPECNKKELIRSEGCKKCTSCGWTACL
jgi:ribonucleoside-diphosphate reductase alpha chain